MSDASRTKRFRYVMLAAALLALIAGGVAVTSPQSIRVPVVTGIAVTIGVVAFITVVVGLSKAGARKNTAETAEACGEHGLHFHKLGKHDDKDAPFSRVAHLQQLRTGSKGLTWTAHDPAGERPLVLLQHQYVVSTGQTTMQIVHTIAAMPCPPAWPAVSLTAENLGHRIAGVFGKRDIQLESDEFNKRWFVTSDDERFATILLGPEMQAWLLGLPKWATFAVGKGQVLCIAKKSIKPKDLGEFIEISEQFAAMIAPELREWVPRA